MKALAERDRTARVYDVMERPGPRIEAGAHPPPALAAVDLPAELEQIAATYRVLAQRRGLAEALDHHGLGLVRAGIAAGLHHARGVQDQRTEVRHQRSDELRARRYAFATDRLRATGHTASDQVETVLYRLVSGGSTRGIKPKREDGVVRPLLSVWREETEAYCRARGRPFRTDGSNTETKRGLIRERIVPLRRDRIPGSTLMQAINRSRTSPSPIDSAMSLARGMTSLP